MFAAFHGPVADCAAHSSVVLHPLPRPDGLCLVCCCFTHRWCHPCPFSALSALIHWLCLPCPPAPQPPLSPIAPSLLPPPPTVLAFVCRVPEPRHVQPCLCLPHSMAPLPTAPLILLLIRPCALALRTTSPGPAAAAVAHRPFSDASFSLFCIIRPLGLGKLVSQMTIFLFIRFLVFSVNKFPQ